MALVARKKLCHIRKSFLFVLNVISYLLYLHFFFFFILFSFLLLIIWALLITYTYTISIFIRWKSYKYTYYKLLNSHLRIICIRLIFMFYFSQMRTQLVFTVYNFVSWYIGNSKEYLETRTEFSDTDELFNFLKT